jgi:hypothetical protein
MTTGRPEQDVLERLRELAGASRGLQPSAGVEASLMREFHRTHAVRIERGAAPRGWLRVAAAFAVLAIPVAFLALQTRTVAPRTPPSVAYAGAALDGFVPVPGAAALPRLESARIVRYELPIGALPAYGVEIVPDAARRAVEAELLVGQDGYARAIRLVQVRADSGSTP